MSAKKPNIGRKVIRKEMSHSRTRALTWINGPGLDEKFYTKRIHCANYQTVMCVLSNGWSAIWAVMVCGLNFFSAAR
jgi:hypothetical protein